MPLLYGLKDEAPEWLVFGGMLRAIDDEDVDGCFRRLELEAELFLDGRKEGRPVRIDRRRRRRICWHRQFRRPLQFEVERAIERRAILDGPMIHGRVAEKAREIRDRRAALRAAGKAPEAALRRPVRILRGDRLRIGAVHV